MDFWTHQESARRNTFWLVLLYAALVLGFSLLAAYVIDAFCAEIYRDEGWRTDEFLTMFRFPLIFFAIPLLVGILTLFSPASLAAGGRSVAESMKGALVQPQTTDAGEKRLLNVVEEMAIASGMPVPPVYMLENEEGINAFAAGGTVNDAVIGVTRGAVAYLDRSELQAVIAHEFSHILNGDMRLNLRFAQLLFGLMCLSEAGRAVLRGLGRGSSRGRRDSKGMGLVMAIAMTCYLVGLLMAFLGRIVQAAVNRQREFLADASSVQFTRNNALAGALKKIGGLSQGSRLKDTVLADNYSHFFFSRTSAGLLSTHPSLKTRILRLEPSWDGVYPVPAPVPDENAPAKGPRTNAPGQDDFRWGTFAPAGAKKTPVPATAAGSPRGAALGGRRFQSFSPLADAAPADWPATAVLNLRPATEEAALAKLRAACREPLDACYLIFALLLGNTPSEQAGQLAVLAGDERRGAILDYKRAFDLVPRDEYLPLIELAVPALKMLSAGQYATFHTAMRRFIEADGLFSFREWVLYQVISSQVGAQYAPRPAKLPAPRRADDACAALLAALAWLEPDNETAERAFNAGLRVMHLPPRLLRERPNPDTLVQSMDILRQSPERLRDAFIQGVAAVVAYDGIQTREEAMFMRLVAFCLSRPQPPEALSLSTSSPPGPGA